MIFLDINFCSGSYQCQVINMKQYIIPEILYFALCVYSIHFVVSCKIFLMNDMFQFCLQHPNREDMSIG